ncbi:acetyl/propionyl/methylcrotonyl-CoA carboxylase subunit alpha [Parablastomonas sp. CN1-191]|uniref:acetyl/propionyl/methylcrotonyl-CoA carboxylase subunit alpha n=1 Tax=Parablastomonas sp. CN1-191 TaxID=3400908 RepID=UPI003BF7C7B7
MTGAPIRSLLVANRGEVAVRVIRAAHEMGIRAVAIYSEADAGALWVRRADAARCIGPAPARQSYLDIAAIIAAALDAGCDAVHPGYGLLSENADFAQAVADAGLRFVGPSPAAIVTLGDKVAARRAAVAAGVPVLPGSEDAVGDADEALRVAESIGWPVAVKASFGGGGRGMRIARDRSALGQALAQARGEAGAAFGRDEVFIERYLDRPRHVEVQVLGDQQGTIIHLGDRDCSVQRRHQKLMEEAPAANLPHALRAAMHEAALRLSRHVGYHSAGTVEFLVDAQGKGFFFLEMNTRLQVEHGVTELVTGVDLVKAQIAIAGGAPVPLAQEDVRVSGHAIQARIAAEDVANGFRPSPGPIRRLRLPLGPWLRFDFGFEEGDAVSPHYDSMFGKVQAWGATRDEARIRLGLALRELDVTGVPTTARYLSRLTGEPDFAAMAHDTGSAERDWPPRQNDSPASLPPAPAAGSQGRRVVVPWGAADTTVAIHGRRDDSARAAVRRAVREAGGEARPSEGPGRIAAPMDAVVARISVAVGAEVSTGDELLVLEAMKMEMPITAVRAGRVAAISAAAGQAVRAGAILIMLEQAP